MCQPRTAWSATRAPARPGTSARARGNVYASHPPGRGRPYFASYPANSPRWYVPLVFLIEVDADLGGIVSTRGPPLELSEEPLGGRLGVRLARRHSREDRDPLVRRGLEERLRVELTRQAIHGLEAGAPLGLPVGLERFRQTAVDVGRHGGGARPGGVVIGGDDELSELIQQRVFRRRQEFTWDSSNGLHADRPPLQQRSDQRRRRGGDHVSPRE